MDWKNPRMGENRLAQDQCKGLLSDPPGCGRLPANSRGRLGLIGMRERVDLLAGEFEIESHIHEGTRVKIRLPLSEAKLGK